MNILLVDDDLCSVSALTNLLQFDHSVRIARNGFEALRLFREGEFDLVVSDVQMPKMNGVELLKALCHEKRNIPIILMSGYSDVLDHEAAEMYGLTAYFTKPIDVGRFMETLAVIERDKHLNDSHNQRTG